MDKLKYFKQHHRWIIGLFLAMLASIYLPLYITKTEHRNTFVENFSRHGQAKIYGAERLFYDLRDGENKDIITAAWNDYMQATKEWNNDNLTSPIFIQYYFNKQIRNEWEFNVLPAFSLLHSHLYQLKKTGTTTQDIKEEIRKLKDIFYDINNRIVLCSPLTKWRC